MDGSFSEKSRKFLMSSLLEPEGDAVVNTSAQPFTSSHPFSALSLASPSPMPTDMSTSSLMNMPSLPFSSKFGSATMMPRPSSNAGKLANSAASNTWKGLTRPAEIRKQVYVNNTWPLWIYYTRYTHRPQHSLSGASIAIKHNRRREKQRRLHESKQRRLNGTGSPSNQCSNGSPEDLSASGRSTAAHRRVRLAFTNDQLKRLKEEFECNHYLNESRRRAIAAELALKEAQVKVWFQNKRAQLRRLCNSSSFLLLPEQQ